MEILKITFLLVAFTIQASISQEVGQKATIFQGRNQAGNFLIIPQTYAPDLKTNNFDNLANSACVTGVWIFYVNPFYNTNQNSGVEYMFGNNNCANFATIGGYISSARFAGSPNDYRSDTLTLFEDDYFQGEEFYTYADTPRITEIQRHKSLIITGTSAWTVFDQINYGGSSICLFPEASSNFKPLLLVDLEKITPAIPYGSIKSIRKGCVGKLLSTLSTDQKL